MAWQTLQDGTVLLTGVVGLEASCSLPLMVTVYVGPLVQSPSRASPVRGLHATSKQFMENRIKSLF